MHEMLEKVKFARETCEKLHIRKGGFVPQEDGVLDSLPPFDIQVDGGIDDKTASLCVNAGANVLVSGSYLYGAKDMKAAIESFHLLKRK